MRFDRETELFEQRLRFGGVRNAVARRIVGRDLHQLGEKALLVSKALIHLLENERFQSLVGFHTVKLRRKSANTWLASSASLAVMVSAGL